MRAFMVELYISRADPEAVPRAALRTQRAAIRMSRRGTPVRYLRSIYVKEDETCFLLYEAESIDAVREAARATGRRFEHVVEVIETGTAAGLFQQSPDTACCHRLRPAENRLLYNR
jgi:hypothetical protein